MSHIYKNEYCHFQNTTLLLHLYKKLYTNKSFFKIKKSNPFSYKLFIKLSPTQSNYLYTNYLLYQTYTHQYKFIFLKYQLYSFFIKQSYQSYTTKQSYQSSTTNNMLGILFIFQFSIQFIITILII